MSPRVLIVGGGVAGCTAALFLHKIGFEVIVYESYPCMEDAVVGVALSFSANGLSTLALYSDELATDIYKRGHKSAYFEMRDADGTVLGLYPAGREGRSSKHGTIMVRRWDILDALLKEIARRGIKVVYEKKVVEVKEGDEAVTIVFEDGSSDSGDLVVGADGIRSVVRKHVAPSAKIAYDGLVAVGGFIPKAALGNIVEKYFPPGLAGDKEKGSLMTSGPLGFFGFAPVDYKSPEEGGQMIWWSQFESRERRKEEWAQFDAMEQVKLRHGHWNEPIPQVLDAVTTPPLVQPIHYLLHADTWHTRRCVLIGDAAHAMPPHSGQGISQAIEDVAELTSVLRPILSSGPAQTTEVLEERLATFERNRRPRINAVLEISTRNGENKREKTWLQCFIRKWFMIIFLAIMPESRTDRRYRCQYDAGVFGGKEL